MLVPAMSASLGARAASGGEVMAAEPGFPALRLLIVVLSVSRLGAEAFEREDVASEIADATECGGMLRAECREVWPTVASALIEEPRCRPADMDRLPVLHVARGKYRVYLGSAPGVGKTFAMLDEGWRRRSRGTDVVIGLVMTHGRANTIAKIRDLEVVPPKHVEYRGRVGRAGRRGSACAATRGGVGRPRGSLTRTFQASPMLPSAGQDIRGVARRRNRGHLDPQHPAPGEPERRRQRDPRASFSARRCLTWRSAEPIQIELIDMSPEALRASTGPRQRLSGREDLTLPSATTSASATWLRCAKSWPFSGLLTGWRTRCRPI